MLACVVGVCVWLVQGGFLPARYPGPHVTLRRNKWCFTENGDVWETPAGIPQIDSMINIFERQTFCALHACWHHVFHWGRGVGGMDCFNAQISLRLSRIRRNNTVCDLFSLSTMRHHTFNVLENVSQSFASITDSSPHPQVTDNNWWRSSLKPSEMLDLLLCVCVCVHKFIFSHLMHTSSETTCSWLFHILLWKVRRAKATEE